MREWEVEYRWNNSAGTLQITIFRVMSPKIHTAVKKARKEFDNRNLTDFHNVYSLEIRLVGGF